MILARRVFRKQTGRPCARAQTRERDPAWVHRPRTNGASDAAAFLHGTRAVHAPGSKQFFTGTLRVICIPSASESVLLELRVDSVVPGTPGCSVVVQRVLQRTRAVRAREECAHRLIEAERLAPVSSEPASDHLTTSLTLGNQGGPGDGSGELRCIRRALPRRLDERSAIQRSSEPTAAVASFCRHYS